MALFFGIFMRWMNLNYRLEDFFNSFSYKMAIKQVYHPVRPVGMIDRMGYHDNGGTFVIQLFQQLHNLFTIRRIKISRGFISEDQFRIGDQGPCHCHALLLSAGKLTRKMLTPMSYPHPFKDIIHGLTTDGPGHLQCNQGQFNILKNIQLINEIKTLKYKTDIAFT